MQLYRQWHRAVGNSIAEHSEPAHLASGVLTVRVDSPVWHQQLHLMKNTLLVQVQKVLPDKKIRELRFRQETLRLRDAVAPHAAAAQVVLPEPHAEDLRQAQVWLNDVKDPALHAALLRLLLTYLTLKRNGRPPP
jgi:hypothetical protein